MIGRLDLQQALRSKLLGLVVASTGVTSLSATATGYHRTAGSFLTENFAVGMDVTPAGFGTNLHGVVTAVTALDLAVSPFVVTNVNGVQSVTRPAMVVESVASGRSLTVGLPFMRAWENQAFEPASGIPYIEEQYVPGPAAITTDGYAGPLELRPSYFPRVYVPANTGILGDGKYADAILRLFAPGTLIPLSSGVAGDSCEVRGDAAPYAGERAPSATAGWSCIPVTIPCRATTLSVPA